MVVWTYDPKQANCLDCLRTEIAWHEEQMQQARKFIAEDVFKGMIGGGVPAVTNLIAICNSLRSKIQEMEEQKTAIDTLKVSDEVKGCLNTIANELRGLYEDSITGLKQEIEILKASPRRDPTREDDGQKRIASLEEALVTAAKREEEAKRELFFTRKALKTALHGVETRIRTAEAALRTVDQNLRSADVNLGGAIDCVTGEDAA